MNKNKIKVVSFFFVLFFQVTFIVLVAAQILGWIFADSNSAGYFSVIPALYQGKIFSPLTFNARVAGFCVTTIPLMFELMVLYFLIKLFSLYRQLSIFTPNNVRYLRNIGYSLLLLQIAKLLSDFILGFILTSGNPLGMRVAIMQMTENNIAIILVALMVILISWIMAEGVRLQADHEFTI